LSILFYIKKEAIILLKNKFTPFGVSVRAKLFEIGQTQEWLISECQTKTGMYVDSSVMYKLLTGQRKSQKITVAICEVLDIAEEKQVG
jgi:hypothetical protein